MNVATAPDPPLRTAPIALWRAAEAFMRILYALFENPEDVAHAHTLARKPYRLMASWLRVGEAMMRRLLLIEAAAFPALNTRPLRRALRPRVPQALSFWPDTPEKWRVSLRCFSSPARGGSVSARRAMTMGAMQRWPREHKPLRFRGAWPLAERYEALIRVFNNPAPYARRLAARLHAAPHRVVELLAAPPETRRRVEDYAALDAAARARWPGAPPGSPNSS